MKNKEIKDKLEGLEWLAKENSKDIRDLKISNTNLESKIKDYRDISIIVTLIIIIINICVLWK